MIPCTVMPSWFTKFSYVYYSKIYLEGKRWEDEGLDADQGFAGPSIPAHLWDSSSDMLFTAVDALGLGCL